MENRFYPKIGQRVRYKESEPGNAYLIGTIAEIARYEGQTIYWVMDDEQQLHRAVEVRPLTGD